MFYRNGRETRKVDTDIDKQAEGIVSFIEKQRSIIKEAQEGYKKATTDADKVAVMKNFLTKKSALQSSLPNREAHCLFSIGPGTATVITTVTVLAL